MRIEKEKYEWIERYLSGELPEAERSDFELKMKEDTSFAEEVQSHKNIHELIIDQGLLELKQKMKAYNDDARRSGNKKKYIYSGLIAIVSITTIAFLTYKSSPREATQQPVQPAIINQQPDPKKLSLPEPEKIKNINKPALKNHINDPETNTLFSDTASKPSEPASAIQEEMNAKTHSITPDQKIYLPEEPKAQPAQEPKTVECNLQNSILKINTTESCNTTPTGKISIDKNSSIKGQAPFEFSINGKSFYTDYTFTNLYSGSYQLSVKDALGCLWQEENEIIIHEIDCSIKEYSFYPSRGEIWEFPIERNSNGKIEIYSRNGSLVYSAIIQNGYPQSWNGIFNGQALPMGSYSYILIQDGKTSNGYVTIFK